MRKIAFRVKVLSQLTVIYTKSMYTQLNSISPCAYSVRALHGFDIRQPRVPIHQPQLCLQLM